jgi:hypothetical protein
MLGAAIVEALVARGAENLVFSVPSQSNWRLGMLIPFPLNQTTREVVVVGVANRAVPRRPRDKELLIRCAVASNPG